MRITLSSTLLHQARESACLFLRIYVLECVCCKERQKEADTDRPHLIMTHFYIGKHYIEQQHVILLVFAIL